LKKLLACVVVALASVPVLPDPAMAQVYPERIVLKEKTRVSTGAYQRRNRDDQNREEQTERITKTLRLGSDGSLSLGNIAGDIVVTRGSGSDTTIEIVKTARGRDTADAKELLQLVDVEVTERNGRAEVKTHYPSGDMARRNNRRNVNVSVDYTVTTPAGTRVGIESISGDIKVTDIKGDLSANTISGDVHISGAGRINAAKTISGSVEIVEAQVDGTLDSNSVSGDVLLRRVTARRIDVGSVSGNVHLEDVQCENAAAHSTSGNITFSGPLARKGRYELKSFSGEIRVTVPSNSGFEVEANSFSGQIRTELPIQTHGAEGRSGHRNTVLNGTYGDGSAILDLTTFSGSIVISKR
jgi:putative adhesin